MGELRREEGGKTFHQGWWENLGLSMGGWEGLVGGAPPKRVGRGRENSGGSIRRRGSTKEGGKRGRDPSFSDLHLPHTSLSTADATLAAG